MALKLIDEKRENGKYSVAYKSEDKKIKIVKIDTGVFSLSKQTSQLLIQKSCLDLQFDFLDFADGMAATHHGVDLYASSTLPFVQEEPKKLEKLIETYSKEFEEIFRVNQTLQEYLPTHFKELNKRYLVQKQ
jgi:hypothetical protein